MRNDGTYLAQLLQEQQRPHPMYMRQQYHFMGGPGWINDPNGLVWYKDAYHFFYQYNPFGLTWGEPCWGHAVSRDLLHWTQLPPALVPSEPYDMYEQGGCFSGCALVVGQRLYLLYTGVCEKDGHCVQAQCLAWSDDGVTFQKYENNPVVCAPVGVDPANFRDPKLWREADGIFYFVCGASLEGEGAALLFSSQDLFQWQYQGVLARSEGRFGTMWECPDLIPLGRKHMLCVSPMHCPAYRNVCLVGTFSREEGKLLNVEPVCPDAGPDYYAAQSFVDDRGQCVQVAGQWMGLDAAVPALGSGGAGLLAWLVHIAARCDRGRGQTAAVPAASAIGNAAQKGNSVGPEGTDRTMDAAGCGRDGVGDSA